MMPSDRGGREDGMSVIAHWLVGTDDGVTVVHHKADAEHWRSAGHLVTGPFVDADQLRGAVADRDALRVMLGRLLDVALVDGYGETVADEARALLTATGGQ